LQGVYFGCLFDADDVTLLSHSFAAMRYMLKMCDDFADEYDVEFNTTKSVAMRIGNRYNKMCEPFVLSRSSLCSLKYLGIVLLSDRGLNSVLNI